MADHEQTPKPDQPFPPLQNDLLLRAAWGQEVEHPPIWIMRQAIESSHIDHRPGRYLPEYNKAKGSREFFECCRDPQVASTLTLLPIDRFAGLLDAAIIFSDILVVPQALGMTVRMDPGHGPVFPHPLRDNPRDDPQYAAVLARPIAEAVAELDYVFAALTLTRHRLAGRVPLIGFSGAPWTLFCYMVEGGGSKMYIHAKTWIYSYPDATTQLLAKITDLCVEYLALQVKAGAQMLMLFDSWAGELSPSTFNRFCKPYLADIASRLPARIAALGLAPVPLTAFAKGAWYALDDLCNLGYQVIALDWQHDPAQACRVRADRPIVFQGNADPSLLYGSHDTIRHAVSDMVRDFHPANRGWIVNLGHGITPGVDPEDLRFFLEEVRRCTAAASNVPQN